MNCVYGAFSTLAIYLYCYTLKTALRAFYGLTGALYESRTDYIELSLIGGQYKY